MEVKEQRRGNPNFGKKATSTTASLKNKPIVRFQLVAEHTLCKPREKETGQMVDNPYPDYYAVPNEGVAYDASTNMPRQWRYIYGYKSIWVDEQLPEPTLAQKTSEKNELVFRQGFLKVNTQDQLKLQALMIQDIYEGNENPVEPKPKIYRMVDEDAHLLKFREESDLEYEAETEARNASLEELLPVAMLYGLNIDNAEDNEMRIRTEVIRAAKQNPAGFMRQFANPKHKIQYTFTKALQKNLLSASVFEGKVVMTDTNKVVAEVRTDGDVSEQLASLVVSGDEKMKKVYDQIELVLK